MRPVNLLPEGDRPAAPATPVKGGAYVVLGVLGALVLATFAYVTTTNQISSRTSDIEQARADIAAAQAQTGALGPFQAFAQVKETRLASVRDLAQARFDWERFMRELALVLPDGSSVSEVTATATGLGEDAGVEPVTPGAPTDAVGSPSATLTGCATSQREVAVMLVRLRQLHRAADVQLTSSSRADSGSSGASSTTSSTTATGTCGSSDYAFDATVSFGPDLPDPDGDAERAPARLGGGS